MRKRAELTWWIEVDPDDLIVGDDDDVKQLLLQILADTPDGVLYDMIEVMEA